MKLGMLMYNVGPVSCCVVPIAKFGSLAASIARERLNYQTGAKTGRPVGAKSTAVVSGLILPA